VHTATPVALFVHICSTRIPFKAAGKQSLASIPEIESDAHHLFMELGRKLSKTAAKVQRSVREVKKMREFKKTLKQIARFSTALSEHENIPSTEGLVRKLFEVDYDA
jgi:DNA topoisomerase-6 subunit B